MRRALFLWIVLALGACGSGADTGSEFPRLTDTSGVDPLVLERLDQALADCEGGTPGAFIELAKTYDANGLPELAAQAYALVLSRGLAQRPGASTAALHYHLARALETLGRHEEALAHFEVARTLEASYAPAHWRAGNLLLDLGRAREAEQAFRRALELEPTGIPQSLGLARVQLLENQPAAALETLLPVSEREPRERLVHGLLARVHRAQGDEQRAALELKREERATKSSVIDPWTAEVAQRAAGVFAGVERANQLLLAGDARGALALLEPLYQKRPDELAVAQMLAKTLIEAGEPERALELLERERALHPDQFKLELFTGLALAAKKNPRRALEHLLAARALNPSYGPIHAALGEVQAKLGEFAPAEVSLARALETGEDGLRDQLLLGQVQLEQEAWERALATFQRACDEFPNAAAAWAHLAEAQARRGDPSAARASLAEAEKRDPQYERLATVRALLSDAGELPR